MRLDIILGYETGKVELLIEMSEPCDFGINNTEIKKMMKYQHRKNEVKRLWKRKSTKIVPLIIGATGMMKKNLTEILKTIPANINTN